MHVNISNKWIYHQTRSIQQDAGKYFPQVGTVLHQWDISVNQSIQKSYQHVLHLLLQELDARQQHGNLLIHNITIGILYHVEY